jgi:hypothetical protein
VSSWKFRAKPYAKMLSPCQALLAQGYCRDDAEDEPALELDDRPLLGASAPVFIPPTKTSSLLLCRIAAALCPYNLASSVSGAIYVGRTRASALISRRSLSSQGPKQPDTTSASSRACLN